MSTLVKTNHLIFVKNAPQIPGLNFRKFRGEEDFAAMAEIINAANRADGEDYLATTEDIQTNYAYLERSDTDKTCSLLNLKARQSVTAAACGIQN